jgi:small subunit ribosomal protein S8
MMTDNIADMLTRIRNGNKSLRDYVDIPASRLKASICKVLKDEGYVKSFKIIALESNNINIRVYLKPNTIQGIQRLSSPGLRRYTSFKDIPRVRSGLGICILSTPKGILSTRMAKKHSVGGELLCSVW